MLYTYNENMFFLLPKHVLLHRWEFLSFVWHVVRIHRLQESIALHSFISMDVYY
jgi:hypothetical protein